MSERDFTSFEKIRDEWRDILEAFTSPLYKVTKKMDGMKTLLECIERLDAVIRAEKEKELAKDNK